MFFRMVFSLELMSGLGTTCKIFMAAPAFSGLAESTAGLSKKRVALPKGKLPAHGLP